MYMEILIRLFGWHEVAWKTTET